MDVSVKNKVCWPHEAILAGLNRQRVTYDQVSLTQWVQGFCKNILEEKLNQRKSIMVSYLSDLMEDATDFTWQGTKAAHAVLMCEIEGGSLQWKDTDRIDRIRRIHAQKHAPARENWARPSDRQPSGKKAWFCKNFQQVHTRDHEFNGKTQKPICDYCLMGVNNGACRKRMHFQKTKFNKQTSSRPSLGGDSCPSVSGSVAEDSAQTSRVHKSSAVPSKVTRLDNCNSTVTVLVLKV